MATKNATNRYLDELAQRTPPGSDYAVAKRLGVTPQHVSNWRRGTVQFSDDMAFKVAAELDLDPMEVLSRIGAERAKEPATREAWKAVFRRVTHDAQPIVFALAMFAAAHVATFEYSAPQTYESAWKSPALSAEISNPAMKIMSNGDRLQRVKSSTYRTVMPITSHSWLNAICGLAAWGLFSIFRRRRGGHHSIGG